MDSANTRLLIGGAFVGSALTYLYMRSKPACSKEGESGVGDQKRKKVLISGCYDLLHSGHVQFFKEASQLGDLYVSVGNDQNILDLKGRPTMIPEKERLFMVQSIKYVHYAEVSPQMGMVDFSDAIDRLKPDIFYVNEDGDKQSKRDLMKQKGVEYVVAKRTPGEGLDARSSTAIKTAVAQKSFAVTQESKSESGKPKLYYFSGRGRANPIRYLLAAAQIDFDEEFVDTRESFLHLRDKTDKLSFKCLPLLEIDGLCLVQTNAMIHYVANKAGFGADPQKPSQVAIVEMAIGGIQDARSSLLNAPFKECGIMATGASTQDAADKVRSLTSKSLEPWLQRLDGFWSKKGKAPFLLGDRLCVADILLFEVLQWTVEYLGAEILQSFVSLQKIFKKLGELPQISEYIRSDRYFTLPSGEEARRYVKAVNTALGRN